MTYRHSLHLTTVAVSPQSHDHNLSIGNRLTLNCCNILQPCVAICDLPTGFDKKSQWGSHQEVTSCGHMASHLMTTGDSLNDSGQKGYKIRCVYVMSHLIIALLNNEFSDPCRHNRITCIDLIAKSSPTSYLPDLGRLITRIPGFM